MKHRRPPPRPPPVVVTKTKRSAMAPTPAAPRPPLPPDRGRIQALRDSDPPRPPPKKSRVDWLQSEVAVHVNRLRMANDPDVMRGAAQKLVHHREAENAMVSILALPDHPRGSGYFVVAKKGTFNILGQALKALFALINFVKPNNATERSPSSLRPFIKAMRKGEPQ